MADVPLFAKLNAQQRALIPLLYTRLSTKELASRPEVGVTLESLKIYQSAVYRALGAQGRTDLMARRIAELHGALKLAVEALNTRPNFDTGLPDPDPRPCDAAMKRGMSSYKLLILLEDALKPEVPSV